MSQNKSSDDSRSGSKLPLKVYNKPVKRASADRNLRIALLMFMVTAFALGFMTIIRVNTELQLVRTQWRLEEARSETDTLWSTVITLQDKNDALNAQNEALKNQVDLEPAIVYKTICSTSSFKSWMDYRAITSKSSNQYKLQLKATTDPHYGFRKIGDYIMVAMGPQYGPVGTKYIIQFKDGKVIQAIIGDIKHTGCQSADSSMLEFIVDTRVLPQNFKISGNFNSLFAGPITVIREVE